MCGIFGMVDRPGATPDPDRIRAAVESIAHRGPDDHGLHVDGRVALGHRRLSILDPSPLGHQPMANPDESVWITYNGEIYNFKDIRDSLSDTRSYRSNADTEVILRAYDELGDAFVDRLRGIFAFGLYDRRRRRILLVRDRFGIKPLYYAQQDGRFYFASEFKPLLEAGVETTFNPLAALDWVFTGWTDDARVLLSGIRRVPPGGIVTYDIDTGRCEERRYYTPAPRAASAADRVFTDRDRIAARDALHDALRDAVRRQLLSDVPVGTFCSGGIDSSLITALASREQPGITAYNVAVADSPANDESPYADMVAKHLGIRLATFRLTREEFIRHAVRTIYHVEYPLSFENAVPMYLVSQLARDEGVPVLLSGEGADELFGGYVGQYRWLATRKLIQARGKLLGGLLNLAIRGASRLMQKATGTPPPGPSSGLGFHEVLCGGLRRRQIEKEAAGAPWPFHDPLDRALAAEWLTQLQTYMLPILHRTDRASMMASVEARVPFLDEDVVDLALRLPPGLKVRPRRFGVQGKAILKDVARLYLPGDVVDRPKMGFQVPLEYHHGAIPRAWIAEGFVRSAFGLNESDLGQWLDSLTGRNRWMFMALEIWGQLFVQHRAVGDVEAEYLSHQQSGGKPPRPPTAPTMPSPRGVTV